MTSSKRTKLQKLLEEAGLGHTGEFFYQKNGRHAAAFVKDRENAPGVPVLFRLLEDGNVLVQSGALFHLDMEKEHGMKIALERIHEITPISIAVNETSDVYVAGLAKAGRPDQVGELTKIVVSVSGDIWRFVVHILRHPELRCDPDASFNWFVRRFISERHSGIDDDSLLEDHQEESPVN